jgi:prevent-host-death family protein
MAKVGIRELKNNLKHYLSLVKNGEQVIITNRGSEIASIVPPAGDEVYAGLSQLVKEGSARWEYGKPCLSEPVKAKGKPASQITIEERQ